MNHWREVHGDESKIQEAAEWCQKRWFATHGAKSLLGAFFIWSTKALEQKQMDDRGMRNFKAIRMMMRHGNRAKGWRSLRDFYFERCRLRSSIKHMTHRDLSKAWRRWVEVCEESLRTKELAMNAYKKWRSRQIGAAFRTWLDQYDEINRQRELMIKAISKMRGKQLAMGFNTWYDKYNQRLSDMDQMRKALIYFMHLKLIKAMMTWRSVYEEGLRLMQLAKGGIGKWSKLALSKGFNKWVEFVEEILDQQGRIRRAIGRFRNRLLSVAFITWVDIAIEHRKHFYLVHRSVMRMTRIQKARSFNKLMEGVYLKRRHKTRGRGWSHGSSVVETSAPLYAKALLYFTNLHTSRAMKQWLEVTIVLRDQSGVYNRAISYFRGGNIPSAWFKWREESASTRYQQYILYKQIVRWRANQVSVAYDTWRSWYFEGDKLMDLREKGVRIWMNRALSKAFQTWVNAYEILKYQKMVFQKATLRWRNQLLAKSFRKWCIEYEILLGERKKAKAVLNILLKKEYRLMNKAAQKWRQDAVEARRDFYIMTKTMVIMKHRKLSQALLWLSEYEWHSRHHKAHKATKDTSLSPDVLPFLNWDGLQTQRPQFDASPPWSDWQQKQRTDAEMRRGQAKMKQVRDELQREDEDRGYIPNRLYNQERELEDQQLEKLTEKNRVLEMEKSRVMDKLTHGGKQASSSEKRAALNKEPSESNT